ncbi:hypothetical protein LINPERPRIM_LOCUS847 [Linum perenne]
MFMTLMKQTTTT